MRLLGIELLDIYSLGAEDFKLLSAVLNSHNEVATNSSHLYSTKENEKHAPLSEREQPIWHKFEKFVLGEEEIITKSALKFERLSACQYIDAYSNNIYDSLVSPMILAISDIERI